MELQATAIKTFLKQCTQSPPSPTDAALNQLIKECQIAMNSTVILAKKNQDLHAANKRQKQKHQQSIKKIAHEGSLLVQEARDLIEAKNQTSKAPTAPTLEIAAQASPLHTQAPPRCSGCNIIGHKINKCPSCNFS